MLNKIKKNSFRKKLCMIGIVISFVINLCACNTLDSNTTIVLTTGFQKDEIFVMENIACTVPEMMVYLTTIQSQYETIYGNEIWDAVAGGITLEENVKETSLARIAQIKAMTLLAAKHNIVLTEEEQDLVERAATCYYETLSNELAVILGADVELIKGLYQDYALANKVYHYLIKDINPEISDDEARVITVQQIFIKTYTLDENGNKVEFTENAKKLALEKAREALVEAKEGTDFSQLVTKYSDSLDISYAFAKGEVEEALETVAFELATDEISGIIEGTDGYYILKCTNTFHQEETDENKIRIVEEKREEAFVQEYEVFTKTITKNLNEELWETITFIDITEEQTTEFFEIYDTFFDAT
ncbi:MAG: peptidylprolyl isomerase [Eubacteriales bacterium]